MKRLIFLLFLFTASKKVMAQENIKIPQTSIKAAYMGSIIYPGFKLGVERPFKVIQKEKRSKTILKERYWTYNLGFYKHQTFHTNTNLLVERQKRRQYPNGFFIETAPGIGYSRTFLGGETYKVDESGTVSKKSGAGYNYAMLSFAAGLGYNFSKKKGIPIKVYFKPSVFILAPYNSFVYSRPTVELGLVYTPNSFWKANPLLKIIKRK